MGLAAPAFLAIWAAMMAAMMFPTAAPMILTFHRIQSGKRARGEAFVSTWLFVAGYLAVWAAAGLVAYLGALVAERLADASRPVGGGSGAARRRPADRGRPLSADAAEECLPGEMPLADRLYPDLVARRAEPARCGWARCMALTCLGCCWLLMVILFPLGLMNIAAMALITLIVFAEKALAWERVAVYGMSAALVAVWRYRRRGAAPAADFAALARTSGDGGRTMPAMDKPDDAAECPETADAAAPPLCRRDRRAGRVGQGHAGAPARRAFRPGASRYRQALPRDRVSRARRGRRPGRSGGRRAAAKARRSRAARRSRGCCARRSPAPPRWSPRSRRCATALLRLPARFRRATPPAPATAGRGARRPRYRHGRLSRRRRQVVHHRQRRGARRAAGQGVAGARRGGYIRRCPAGHEGTRRARQRASGRAACGGPRRRDDRYDAARRRSGVRAGLRHYRARARRPG